jgi:hypothetical protein
MQFAENMKTGDQDVLFLWPPAMLGTRLHHLGHLTARAVVIDPLSRLGSMEIRHGNFGPIGPKPARPDRFFGLGPTFEARFFGPGHQLSPARSPVGRAGLH